MHAYLSELHVHGQYSRRTHKQWGRCLQRFGRCANLRELRVQRQCRRLGGGLAHFNSAALASVIGCQFAGNSAESGGALELWNSAAHLQNCTLSDNAAEEGGGLRCNAGSSCELDNSIIAFSTQGEAVGGDGSPTLVCCDLFGNAGGDWVGVIAGQYGQDGNIAEDPLFCGESHPTDPYTLWNDSPCLPEANPACGLIGARPEGCSPAASDGFSPVPETVFLARPTPNPARFNACISYGIPAGHSGCRVRLDVFDPAGRLVRGLVDELQPAGSYRVTWDGANQARSPVPAGVYLCRLSVGGKAVTSRILLVR
ncbi:MAG: hypothetical protein KAY24_17975 [Candidatus Eisenbacteria sp.]|nr:hypothetical protein [Candidatus Eisenbacteria bacterium]